MRLKNKTALITGGNSGIGLATARVFVAEGARVVITGRNRETLDAAAKDLGPNALALVADVNDSAATETAARRGAEKFGKYDILFANAGIAGGTPLGATDIEAFQKVISTNLTGVFFTVQSALPHLNDNASIILNGSVISVLGIPGYSAYGAAKAGVRAMARIMASELSPRGIRVNAVAPGFINIHSHASLEALATADLSRVGPPVFLAIRSGKKGSLYSSFNSGRQAQTAPLRIR
jgi:NAD(P)-dependent dehydrogenase (short-subunit alcohol dehydrogenase family)